MLNSDTSVHQNFRAYSLYNGVIHKFMIWPKKSYVTTFNTNVNNDLNQYDAITISFVPQ